MTDTARNEVARLTDADLDAIVGADRARLDEVVHEVDQQSKVLFTWDYSRSRPALAKLYEKGKASQWNATTDLPWDTDVDLEKVALELGGGRAIQRFRSLAEAPGSPLRHFGHREFIQLGIENQNLTLSQFLHGEQGALIVTGLIVAHVPWIDAKYYAATQVVDEARHVEVFSRYLDEKLTSHYPISPELGALLDDIIADPRWDITYLGMQIIVEGLALAAFGAMHMATTEPLLKQLLRYVMSDEARHVAFGVLSLKEFYAGLSAAELRERQEFAFDAATRMRNRSFQLQMWERLGVERAAIERLLRDHPPPAQRTFQGMLFSKIVPNCKKLGLLDAGDGWLRQRFTDLGVIEYENWVDTSEEYGALDEVARDRTSA
jgi:hypothetical protein